MVCKVAGMQILQLQMLNSRILGPESLESQYHLTHTTPYCLQGVFDLSSAVQEAMGFTHNNSAATTFYRIVCSPDVG